MDSDGPPEPITQLAQGGEGVRIGLIPAKYDAQRKKTLWYWFIAHGARGVVSASLPSKRPCMAADNRILLLAGSIHAAALPPDEAL
jgi:hypothetical protein